MAGRSRGTNCAHANRGIFQSKRWEETAEAFWYISWCKWFHQSQNCGLRLNPTFDKPLNPRPAGGAYSAPPPSRIFAITWELRTISPPNFQYLMGHQFDTLSENFVKFGWQFFEKMTFQWRHAMRFWAKKMVVSYIDHRSMNAEANRKQKVSKQRKLNYLQDGYLGFLNFWILTLKI